MKNRILTALALVVLFLPAFLIGGMLMKAVVAIVVGLCVSELTSFRKMNWNLGITSYIYAVYVGLCFVSGQLFPWLLLVFSFSLFVISFVHEKFSLLDVLFYSAMALFLTFAGRSTMALEDMGPWYMIYVVSVTYSVDTGGFFGGKFFGKNKLIERISPKKTWEGAIVGFLAGCTVSLVFHTVWGTFSWPITIIMSIVLSIAGQLGDLMFSSIKRFFNVKDFGSLLPGHGGILDRIDSLLVNVVMMTFLIVVFS